LFNILRSTIVSRKILRVAGSGTNLKSSSDGVNERFKYIINERKSRR
jgi:hypothetical protein